MTHAQLSYNIVSYRLAIMYLNKMTGMFISLGVIIIIIVVTLLLSLLLY